MSQIGVVDLAQFATLDGLAYTGTGRNLKTWWNFEDFLVATAPYGIWGTAIGGTGSVYGVPVDSISSRPGQMYIATAAIADYASLYTGGVFRDEWRFGAGVFTFETEIYIGILSTAIEEYQLCFGFGDTNNADQVDGVYFRYDRTANVNWLLCAANNSTRTATASSVAVAAASWVRLKIVVNATGTSASFYINGAYAGAVTTNIPTAGGRELGAIHASVKSAGATGRYFAVDWTWLHVDLTASR